MWSGVLKYIHKFFYNPPLKDGAQFPSPGVWTVSYEKDTACTMMVYDF